MNDQDIKKLIDESKDLLNRRPPSLLPSERPNRVWGNYLNDIRQHLSELTYALSLTLEEKNKWQDNYDGAMSDLSHAREKVGVNLPASNEQPKLNSSVDNFAGVKEGDVIEVISRYTVLSVALDKVTTLSIDASTDGPDLWRDDSGILSVTVVPKLPKEGNTVSLKHLYEDHNEEYGIVMKVSGEKAWVSWEESGDEICYVENLKVVSPRGTVYF